MPMFSIEIRRDKEVIEELDVEFPDREAARMFVLNKVYSKVEQTAQPGESIEIQTTVRDAEGNVLDTVYSVFN